MDVNSTFLNDQQQPTRQDPATGTFSSPDATIVHAAFRDRHGWEPLDTLSSDDRPILIKIHLPTEKMKGENGSSGIGRKAKKRNCEAAFTTAVDEQLRGSGLTDGESMTQMYRSFWKVVPAAAQENIGLKAVRMTGVPEDAGNLQNRERTGRAKERLVIHSEEYKAKDREIKNISSERKADIMERKVTTANSKDVVNYA